MHLECRRLFAPRLRSIFVHSNRDSRKAILALNRQRDADGGSCGISTRLLGAGRPSKRCHGHFLVNEIADVEVGGQKSAVPRIGILELC